MRNASATGGAAAVERALRATAARRPPGSRLPSVRALMKEHRVGPATVEAVLGRLAREGIVDPRPGEGTFVAAAAPPVVGDHGWQTLALGAQLEWGAPTAGGIEGSDRSMIDLAADHPEAALQPRRLLARAASRAAAEDRVWAPVDPAGRAELRAWFAGDIGAGLGAEDVVITAGRGAALASLFTALAGDGADGGPSAVLVESPCAPFVLAVARMSGLRPVPVPTDHDGVRPEHLDAAFARSGARLAYLQPLLAEPSGATLAVGRRAAVLEVAARHGAFLVEDDAARYLADPSAPAPLAATDPDGHVAHVRSLHQATAPGLGVAAVAARGPLRRRLAAVVATQQLGAAPLAQAVALHTAGAAGWARHLRALRRELADRQQVLDEALAPLPVAGSRPAHGGLGRWVRLRDERDDLAVAATLRRAGVALQAGRPCFAGEAAGAYLRLSVGAAGPAELRRATGLLASVLSA